MLKRLAPTCVFLLALTFAGTAQAGVNVVATVPDLAALAKAVGGKHVDVISLSLPTQDPHFVDAKPSLLVKLNRADVLIAVGLELEIGWLPTLQTSARNPKILSSGSGFLDCSTVVKIQDRPAGAIDRSMGDVHPGGNPHYLVDPRQGLACATAIADKLAAADPKNAATYRANLAAFRLELGRAVIGWNARMKPFAGKPVVTYHRSWTYLTSWLGLVEIAELEPKPGIPPTPSHVASVIRLARAKGAKVLLQEAFYPDKTGRMVAEKIGGTVVAIPGGTDLAAGETYLQHVEETIASLEKALR